MNEHHEHHDVSREHHRRRGHGWGTVLVGLAFLTVGALLTLDNFGVLRAEDYLMYWPLFLVLVGFTHILRPATSRRVGCGLVWIGIGSILLLHNLDLLSFDVWQLWPLFFILIGLSMLLRGFRRRRPIGDDSTTFSATAVMGADVRRITADSFEGGEATAVMGGCEIDLRGAGAAGGTAQIDCFALWGGVEIRVPEDWEVEVRGTAILGGFDDKTRRVGEAAAKRLIIRGTAIMGGVEIKN